MTPRVRLSAEAHHVYELDDGLLLVFKPALHAEPRHVHSSTQRLRVLRGRLEVRVDGETLQLTLRVDATYKTARRRTHG